MSRSQRTTTRWGIGLAAVLSMDMLVELPSTAAAEGKPTAWTEFTTTMTVQTEPVFVPDEAEGWGMDIARVADDREMCVAGYTGNGIDVVAAPRHAVRERSCWVNSATGLGALETPAGTDHATIDGSALIGAVTVTEAAWEPVSWVLANEAAIVSTESDDRSGNRWPGTSWSCGSCRGNSWS